eukprot:264876-Amphidinium_carterae.1
MALSFLALHASTDVPVSFPSALCQILLQAHRQMPLVSWSGMSCKRKSSVMRVLERRKGFKESSGLGQ